MPKERLVAYPRLGRDAYPTPPVGWAGWEHLRCAQALAATCEQRRAVDRWPGMRLVPILAGLADCPGHRGRGSGTTTSTGTGAWRWATSSPTSWYGGRGQRRWGR
ncbi:MAG: DUF7008 domain-containing protein [Pseudonocardiaceae bacterium]